MLSYYIMGNIGSGIFGAWLTLRTVRIAQPITITITAAMIDRIIGKWKWTAKYFDNWFIMLQAKMTNICWFWLCKCKALPLLSCMAVNESGTLENMWQVKMFSKYYLHYTGNRNLVCYCWVAIGLQNRWQLTVVFVGIL